MADFGGGEGGRSPIQTVDKKLFAPEGGRIALSANERIAEFLILFFKPSLLMSTS